MTSQRFLGSPLLVLGASLLMSLSACSAGTDDAARAQTPEAALETGSEQPPHNVRVVDLERSDLEEYLLITGPLRGRRATDVSTEEAGVVESLAVRKGGLTKAGNTIVQLDRRLLEAEKKSAEAAVTLREYNNERTRSLLDANSVSKQEMLIVHTELEQARQAARIAELRFERAAIPAPFAGVVVDHYVEVGELVSPGQRVARVVDPFRLELEGSVTEREVGFVEEGAPALVTVEGVAGMIPGQVRWVSFEANPITGKFGVEIEVGNRDLRLRAGVVGRARVLTRVHEEAVVIPRDAVVRSNSGLTVYVVEGDRAMPRPVTLGSDQGMMVIASSGLEGHERVVVRGQRQLNPGGRVVVQEIATARDGSMPGDPPEVREQGNLDGLRELGRGTRPLSTNTGAVEEPR